MKEKGKSNLLTVLFVFFTLMLGVGTIFSATNNMVVKDLKVEYRVNPIGIDVEKPRFSWRIESEIKGQKQTAYRIRVSSTPQGDGDLWDSEKIISGESVNIEYEGRPLKATTRYYWNVTIWDKDNQEVKSFEEAYFETGLMDSSLDAWDDARWIGAPEITLAADYLPVFKINYTMRLVEESTKAGFVFGANDPRLNDWTKNNWLVAGENYIYIELDVTGLRDNDPSTVAKINIWRKGYCSDDYKNNNNITLVDSIELINKVVTFKGKEYFLANDVGLTAKNINDPINFQLVTSGNNISIAVNGIPLKTVGEVSSWGGTSVQMLDYYIVNPYGAIQDVPCFPRLNDIGFGVGENDTVVFTNVSVQHFNPPNSIVFGQNVGATYTIFDGLNNVTVDGNEIIVIGSNNDTLVYADPSYGSIPMLRKEFPAKQEVKNARLYVTARGIYEMYINGERVGNDWFNPGYTWVMTGLIPDIPNMI